MEWSSLSLSLSGALTSSFHCVGVDICTIDYSVAVYKWTQLQHQQQQQQFLIVLPRLRTDDNGVDWRLEKLAAARTGLPLAAGRQLYSSFFLFLWIASSTPILGHH